MLGGVGRRALRNEVCDGVWGGAGVWPGEALSRLMRRLEELQVSEDECLSRRIVKSLRGCPWSLS